MVSVDQNEILGDPSGIGSKAIRLAELSAAGFKVPLFRVIRNNDIDRISNHTIDADQLLQQIAIEVGDTIKADRYAVRSAAFLEDDAHHSHAGQFKTLLDLPISDIPNAIREVIKDARTKNVVGARGQFSVIIQAYIDAEYAGVMFTRNPLIGREMVIEWRNGPGAEVVSGSSVERESIVRRSVISKEFFPGFTILYNAALKIEERYDFPQDIEWAFKQGVLFIVQTRPITTVSKKQHKGYCLIEKEIDQANYYFDQKTLGETFLRPTNLSFEILRVLHSPKGAIARCYEKIGITFIPVDIFCRFASVLYIDKEKELKQFFPAYSYFGSTELKPHMAQFKGFWTTIHNMLRLRALPLKQVDIVFDNLRVFIRKVAKELVSNAEWDSWLKRFDSVYEHVYMVNILSDKALKSLEAVAAQFRVSSVELMILPIGTEVSQQLESEVRSLFSNLRGNSINITDESPFKMSDLHSRVRSSAIPGWWSELPEVKQNLLRPHIELAQRYAELREEGRLLSVLAMNGLRNTLFTTFGTSGITDASLAYFATINEVSHSQFDADILQKRKTLYEAGSLYELPSSISSIIQPVPSDTYGVSPGVSSGAVCDLTSKIHKGCILRVDRLEPELTKYFDIISGIISREGGILSHLAIVAREYGIPVVINSCFGSELKNGTQVTIDGSKGTISLT